MSSGQSGPLIPDGITGQTDRLSCLPSSEVGPLPLPPPHPRPFTKGNASPGQMHSSEKKTQQYKYWICGLRLLSHTETGFFQKVSGLLPLLLWLPLQADGIIPF